MNVFSISIVFFLFTIIIVFAIFCTIKLHIIVNTSRYPYNVISVSTTSPSSNNFPALSPKTSSFPYEATNTQHWCNISTCSKIVPQRKFLIDHPPRKNLFVPVLLYSFPGSGNTWCRLLIEWSTGIFTGSMYDDKSLINILPGESHCDLKVSAVKAHPHIHKYSALVVGGNNISSKCSSVKRFHKFLLLIRDPFDSIWSEFQRRITGGSHNGRVVRDRAGRYLAAWKRVSRYLAAEYVDMWENNYLPLLRDRTVDTMITRYEDLRNADKRLSELKKMVQFIDVDAPKSAKGVGGVSDTDTRVCCAFLLAESGQVHRPERQNAHRFVSKEDVYTEQSVCMLWNNYLGKYSSHGGYGVYKNITCKVLSGVDY